MSRWTKISIALFCIIAFTIPFEYEYNKLFRLFSKAIIPSDLTLPPTFNKRILFYRSDFAILALFFIAVFALRIPLRRFFFEKYTPLLWSFFLLSFLSILFSPLAHYALPYTRLLQLLTPFLFFSLCAHNTIGAPSFTRWMFLSLVFGGLVQTCWAIAQYFFQSSLGLSFLGESKTWCGAFHLPSGNRWIFDAIFHRIAPVTSILRTSGTFNHPNLLGGFLAVSLFASYSLILDLKQKSMRTLLLFSLPVQFFALSTTFSRSALFGWALGTLLWFSLFFYRYRTVPLRLLIAIFFSVCLSASLLSEQFFYRGGIVNYNQLARNSDALRLSSQNNAFFLIPQKPLLGHGYHEYEFTAHLHGIDTGFPHNIYLVILVETGIFSLFAFLLFAALLFRASLRSSLSPQILSLVAILAALLFIGGCDHYPFRSQQGKLLFFIAAGLLASHCLQTRRSHVLA